MPKSITRRNFMKVSAAAAVVAGTKTSIGAEDTGGIKQEYYELRVYQTTTSAKMKMISQYLETALMPAHGRMGIDRIGVFTNLDKEEDYSVYMLIPYATLDVFAAVNPSLLADKAYLEASKEHFAANMDDPVYTRINSKLFKAFSGMPVIEMPVQTAEKKPRIFEYRIYESHTEEKAALKVDMFNSGEIQIMRDSKMGPVFFGEALIGDDIPNLAYMLSADNKEAHKAHWKTFVDHPEWKKLQKISKYDDTVSKITSIFLKPLPYSQI